MPTPPADRAIASRAASTEWEFIALGDEGAGGVWAWFQPPAIPHGLSVSIPPETYALVHPTPRRLLTACGWPVEAVAAWSTHGSPTAPLAPDSPVWDQPLTEPPPGIDPQIHFWGHVVSPPIPTVAAPVAATPSGGTPATGNDIATLARMENDWHAITNTERQLAGLRKQLDDVQSRLGSLNRDLSSDEMQSADRQDINAWQDARRWLRDCAMKVAQCLKAQTIGDSSDAGRRQWFEQVYANNVMPRQTFDGLAAASREFEQHRKLVQTLQLQMSNALARATQDGEQRAKRVLSQIVAKKGRRKPGR